MGFRAEEVRPQKWHGIRILFDDGVYSVIAGVYQATDGREGERLGERWNGGEDTLGFPNQAGYPIWHAAPPFLEVPLLHGLLDELARRPGAQVPDASVPLGAQAEARTRRVLDELARRLGGAG